MKTLYTCTNCPQQFDNFPAAHNHELSTAYKHLTNRVEELALCHYQHCTNVVHAADAIWNHRIDAPFCSVECHNEEQANRLLLTTFGDIAREAFR